ncbi:MAG: hypothetical protein ACXADH_17250 [Candidatus Kariarchaeaceae archaeon]|jgi:hypothetical protein
MYKKLFSIVLIVSVSLFFACDVGDIVYQLTRMTQDELNYLYENSEPGPIPVGESEGTVIFAAGTVFEPCLQLLLGRLWQGKTFQVGENDEPYVENLILYVREMFPADVYYGDSLYDGNETIIIDYSKLSPPPVNLIQDEIRLIEEDVYLGQMWMKNEDGDYVFIGNFVCDLRGVE